MSAYLGNNKPGELKTRLYIATGIAVSVFFLLIVRLWFLQVFEGKEFKELSENNRVRLVRETAPRGLIMDRTGKTIVENRPAFHLAIIPEDAKDLTKIKQVLPAIVNNQIYRHSIQKRPYVLNFFAFYYIFPRFYKSFLRYIFG